MRLPVVALDDQVIAFSIAPQTVGGLANFLFLAAEGECCAKHALEPLRDPGLCLWTLVRSREARTEPLPASLADLAEILHTNWPRWLDWSDVELGIDQRVSRTHAVLRRRAAARWAVLESDDARWHSADGLWASLADWREWLAACQVEISNQGMARIAVVDVKKAIDAIRPADVGQTRTRRMSAQPADPRGSPQGNEKRLSAPEDWLPRLANLAAQRRADRKEFESAVEAAKLVALKNFAYGAGHEINNPLASISARAQTLVRDEADPDRKRALAAIHAQAHRAHEMIAGVMLFARPPCPELRLCDLREVVSNAVTTWSGELDMPLIHVESKLPEDPCPALIDRAQTSTALLALLRNAREAVGSEGSIHVRVVRNDNEGTVQVEVEDSGPGIPAEIRPFIFDPFFSGREAGRGLGFGLSVAWRIVTDHGGTIRVDDSPGPGTRVAIFFALSDQPPPQAMNP